MSRTPQQALDMAVDALREAQAARLLTIGQGATPAVERVRSGAWRVTSRSQSRTCGAGLELRRTMREPSLRRGEPLPLPSGDAGGSLWLDVDAALQASARALLAHVSGCRECQIAVSVPRR